MLSQSARYFIPDPSRWPIFGSLALLSMAFGAAAWMNEAAWGKFLLIAGLFILIYMLFGWIGAVARESEGGKYNQQVDTSFRWGMSWFIYSEVMFFFAFFAALFYMRVLSVPDLGSLDSKLLWPDFIAQWPTAGPGIDEKFRPMGVWGIPALNTLLLLSSGVTVTWAHWGMLQNNRSQMIIGLMMTIALGASFLGFQAYEYGHAYSELNITLATGAYGATFYLLTGFHGFHVTVGAVMLMTILGRCIAGHFTADHHFGFVGVIWYWHFVDWVWLLLFVVVYWL
jgi:cytochrome c oxidase subunit 3